MLAYSVPADRIEHCILSKSPLRQLSANYMRLALLGSPLLLDIRTWAQLGGAGRKSSGSNNATCNSPPWWQIPPSFRCWAGTRCPVFEVSLHLVVGSRPAPELWGAHPPAGGAAAREALGLGARWDKLMGEACAALSCDVVVSDSGHVTLW